ncbi:MAG: type I-E CRISPR-associated protein Cas6/Cse3/CasE [Thermoguttaceae bacterium]|nr:type I-E CRISPR-associated protein Cas6/Cse3/CasE [Thermoguttaceae bacterium]
MTTYLTQGVVSNVDAAKRRLKDRYDWHQYLWKFFPGVELGSEHEFLWRIDRKDVCCILWLLSEKKPDVAEAPGRWATKEVADTFLTHRRYEFSLCANPTVMRVVRLEDGSRRKNGRRTAIYDRNELEKWLSDKGTNGGFVIERLTFDPPTKDYFFKSKDQKGVHSNVEFRGVLNVVDSEKFTAAWKTGIGPAKGFGFGLLLLNPIE